MTVLTKPAAKERLSRRAAYLRTLVSTGTANGYDFDEIAALDIAICALSDTEKQLLNAKRRRKRGVLKKRIEWLRSRSKEGEANSFDLQEIGALEFAVSTIDEHFLNVQPMQGDPE